VSSELPLFPLGMVALPSEAIPLHIFEQRYRTMIEHCLEQEIEFGIVWLSDEELQPIGCACLVERVLERMDDGRLNILARGTRAFRLLERIDHLPYPAGEIEFLHDPPEQAHEASARTAREVYGRFVEEATDDKVPASKLDHMSAYEMAATVDFGEHAKQGLLELRSENSRMDLVTRLMRIALKRLELVDRAQVRARSNGKVRFG
jgi:Lon protease-like protein